MRVLLIFTCVLCVAVLSQTVASSAVSGWPTYQHDAGRSGVDPDQGPVTGVNGAWTTQLDGQVYAQPLIVGSTAYAATENNTVYALDSGTGSVLWQQHLSTPAALSQLPCGNINPYGITSTPVIDAANNVLYAVGLTSTIKHVLYALDLGAGGRLKYSYQVDAPGSDPSAQGQRGALTLANGKIFIVYAGRFGDCGTYTGRVVAVNTGDATGTSLISYSLPSTARGGIWAAASADAAGNIYVASGNSNATGSTPDRGESVVKLSSTLKELDFFTAPEWQSLNVSDTDIGSIGPMVLQNGWILQSGKNGMGYLINSANMGHVGGQLFEGTICGGEEAIGFGAYMAPNTIFIPCTSSLRTVHVNTSGAASFSVTTLRTGYSGDPGSSPPIIAGGLVWNLDRGASNGRPLLLGFDPATGQQVVSQALAASPQNFVAPASGAGHVFVPVGSRLEAFSYAAASTSTLRVNAGGAAYTGGDGRVWQADTGFSAGTPASTTAAISGTPDPPLYQTERYGNSFNYTLSVPNGNYNVVLKFAEFFWSSPGQRVFNVAVNGQQVLSNFDILANVPKNTALDKTFTTSVTGGTLTIALTTVKDNAKISAIEITPGTTTLVRTNAGGAAYTGSDGRVWQTDTGFSGGTPASTTAMIGGTPDPTLYQSERYGKTFSYAFSVSNGSYTVVLKFAEIFWSSPGERVFNVTINGQQVLSNFDILANVPKNTALDRSFTTNVTNGTLTISLTTVADNAKISAVEILPSSGPPPPATPTRLNAGGPAYTGGDGRAWHADMDYTGGGSASTAATIGGTSDATLYQSERYGNMFSYAFFLPNGTYSVGLKFAEIYWSSPGQRVFNVAINGQTVLSNFDILATVPKNTALDKTFTASVTNGTLTVSFTTVRDNAKISAIEIVPGP